MSEKPIVFGPCSKKQQIIMSDDTTDVLLIGGGEYCASTLKTLS